MGFPGDSDSKESVCIGGDLGLIPRLGRSPGEGNGDPLHDSSLENPMDRGAWQVTVYGVTKSRMRLSNEHFHFPPCPSWETLIMLLKSSGIQYSHV